MAAEVMYRAYFDLTYSKSWWFDEFIITKRTECGVWVNYYGKKKFILNNSRKKFAYPTKEEAVVGYIKRTERYIKILRSRLERATEELAGAKGEPFEKPVLLLPYLELGKLHGC